MSEVKPKKKKWKLKKFLLIFLVILAFGSFCFLFGKFGGSAIKDNKEVSVVVLEHELQEVQELATLTYHYRDMGKFTDVKMFNDIKIPFTTSEFIVAYEGEIKTGINLLNVKVKKTHDGFSVTLPEAEVLSHEIFTDTAEILDEKNSVFNKIGIADYNGFYSSQKDKVEKKAVESGMLDKSRENAVKLVNSMLSNFETEDIKIEVK